MKEMTLTEGIQMMIDGKWTSETPKGLLKVIGSTDVHALLHNIKEELNGVVIESSGAEQVEKVLKDETTKDIFVHMFQGKSIELRTLAIKYEKNIVAVASLPKKIDQRLAQISDFRHLDFESDAALITGITSVGVNRVKNRFGHTGEIDFSQIDEFY